MGIIMKCKQSVAFVLITFFLVNIIPLKLFAQAETGIKWSIENGNEGINWFTLATHFLNGAETRHTDTTFEGRRARNIGTSLGTNDRLAYFEADDSWYYNGNETLYATIEYFDFEGVRFRLEYDGTNGIDYQSRTIQSKGTQQWQKISVELPNARFANKGRFGTDFTIRVLDGGTSFYISSITISKSNTEYEPLIVFNDSIQDAGIKLNGDFDSKLYNNKYVNAVKPSESIKLSVDTAWGKAAKNAKVIVQYLNNGVTFEAAHKGKAQEITSGGETGNYVEDIIYLENCDFSSDTGLILTNKSKDKDLAIASVKLVNYDGEIVAAKLESIKKLVNQNSDFVESNVKNKSATKVTGTFSEDGIRYYSLDFGQTGEVDGKEYDSLFVTVEYLDNGTNYDFIEIKYQDDKGHAKSSGKLYFGNTGLWREHTFVLLNAYFDSKSFTLYSTYSDFHIGSVNILEKAPFETKNYYDFAADFGMYQNSMRTTQGYRGWSFNTYIDSKYEALSLIGGQWKTKRDSYPYLILKTSGPTFHPGRYEDLALAWQAQQEGEITIYSTPKMESVNAGNGVNAKVLHGSRLIANRDISPTDNYGETDVIKLNVKKGDTIYFRLNAIESQLSYDVTQWDIKIAVDDSLTVAKQNNAVKTSAWLNVGTVSNGNGIMLIPSDDRNFYTPKENGTVLIKHSPIDNAQRVAFRLDESFTENISGLNPMYFSIRYYDSAGLGLKLQYTNAEGQLCFTDYAKTYGTNTWRNAYFMISDIDLNKDITIFGELGNGINIMRIEASTVPMSDYEINSKPNVYEGLYPLNSTISSEYFEVSKELSFNIHDSYLYRQSSTPVYLEVEYYDNDSAIQIEYDSVDTSNEFTEVHNGRGTDSLQKAFFKLPKGYFGNRQADGSDFKIINKGELPLLISSVKLSKTLSPSYYAQLGFGLDVEAESVSVDSKTSLLISENNVSKAYLDDNFIFNLPNSGLYYAVITYKDSENVKFRIDYDGHQLPDGYIQTLPKEYRQSWTVNAAGTNQWKTTLLSLPYAKFANSQDGNSDFQIVNLGADLYIENIEICSGATLGLRDLATLDCIVELSSLGEDGTEANKNIKAFGPDYAKIGLGGILDGTSSEGPDYITVRFPYKEKTKVNGMKVSSFADFSMEYWNDDNGQWVKIIDITDAYTVPHDERIIMFDPVYTSAIRYSGYDYRGNFYLKKVEVYGEAGQARTLHKGQLTLTQDGPFEQEQDAVFKINSSNFDADGDTYDVKVHWKNYYKETIVDNFITATVGSSQTKDIDVVIPHTHDRYKPGPYYLTVEVWKGNTLLDSHNELWGIKGIAPRETNQGPAPRYMKERSLGTIGQFHFGLGSPIEPEGIKQLKNFGYDSIQIECYWGDLEPIKGVYNFELYDRALEVAREAGLTVDLSIHMLDRRVPSWIPDEEIMRDQFGGYVVPRSMQIYAYNDVVYTPSYWGEVAMSSLYKAVELMAQRYKDDPIVSGYAMATAACEVSFSSDAYRFYDYSKYSQIAYKEVYLQGELGLDLDGVNERWGTNYKSWDEISMFAPPYDLHQVETNPEWADTLDFLHYTITHYQKQISNAIRKHDRSRDLQFFMNEHYTYDKDLVSTKLKYNDSGVGDLAVENGDSFPQYAFFGRIVGVRVHSEPGNIPAKSSLNGNAGRALFLSASGGRSTITWQASKLPRAVGKSLTTDTVAADEGLAIIKKNQRLTEEVLGAQYSPNEAAAISQLKSWSTEKALRNVGRSTDAFSNGLTKNQLETALLEHEFDDNLHRGVDWFNAEFEPEIYMSLDKLKKYKIIFDCGNKVLNATAQENLIEYVRQGGKLVLMGDSGYLDDRRENEWNLLKQLSGGKAVPPDEISEPAVPVVFATNEIFTVERAIRLRNIRDISSWTWAQTLGTSSGNPVVKKWDFGKGSVIYCAGVPDILVTPQFRGWLSSLYDWAGVSSKVETKYKSITGSCEGIYTGVKEVGSDRYVIMWSNSPNGQTSANVKLNYIESGKTYNVYLMEEDHDVFLQTVVGSQFLNNDIVFEKNEFKVLKYSEAQNFNLNRDFSGEQHANRFTYGFNKGTGFVNTIKFDEEKQIHVSENIESAVGRGFFVPKAGSKAILKWTSPSDGFVNIKGKIEAQIDAENVKATIVKNDKVIWSNTIDSKYYNSKAVAEVKKCDKIYFIVEGDGNFDTGKVFWDINIDLSPKAEIYEINQAFQTDGQASYKSWVAPYDGKAIVYGKTSSDGSINSSAIVAILRNDLGIWRQTLYGGSESEHFVEIDVKKNQVIKFVVEENPKEQNIVWTPNVLLIK